MDSIKQTVKNLCFMLLPVLVFFAVLEGGARIYELRHPPMLVDIGQGFGRESHLFAPERGGVMRTHPDKRVSFQDQQFLVPKPARTFRIFALGGSSVNYLDYEFSQLEEALHLAWSESVDAVEIINCGGLSYGTHRLVLITAEIVHYAPDLVLLYSGHNEFEEIQQLHLAQLPFVSAQRTLGASALFRVMRDVLARRQIQELDMAREKRELAVSIPDTSKSWMHVFTEAEIEARMDAYRDNLTAIITLCREQDVPIIIGTVPSNLVRPNLPGEDGVRYEAVAALFEQGRYEEGLALGRDLLRNATPRHQASDAENEIIRQLALQLDVPLADVEQAVIASEPNGVPGETLFNDHCHLNPEGNRILRDRYQDEILKHVAGRASKMR